MGWRKYRKSEVKYTQDKVDEFLERYHYHRPHMGLGMKIPLNSEN